MQDEVLKERAGGTDGELEKGPPARAADPLWERPALREQHDRLEAEFWNLDRQARGKALRLWAFWKEHDEELAEVYARLRLGEPLTNEQMGSIYVAMLRADGRRAGAARAALTGLRELQAGGLAGELAASRKAQQEAARTIRGLEAELARAETKTRQWATLWKRTLGKARAAAEKLATSRWDKARRKQEAEERRAGDTLRGLGIEA